MVVSWVIGVPPVIIHFSRIVHYEPSILGTPILGHLHISIVNGVHKPTNITGGAPPYRNKPSWNPSYIFFLTHTHTKTRPVLQTRPAATDPTCRCANRGSPSAVFSYVMDQWVIYMVHKWLIDGYYMVIIWLMMVNNGNVWRFSKKLGGTPIAGWFIIWKLPNKNGWWLGVPLFQGEEKTYRCGIQSNICGNGVVIRSVIYVWHRHML